MNMRMIELIDDHLRRHPGAEVVDVYKLLYQAANGPAHFFMYGGDRNGLEEKWHNAYSTGEMALEPVSADGQLVRAHFGELKSGGYTFQQIWDAVTFTAANFQPRPELMIGWWNDLGDLIASEILKLTISQYIELNDEFQQWGFVVKHHSRGFVREFKPAYLVVFKRLLDIHIS